MKGAFRHPGSKWGISNWIISHFPEGYEKMVYLEPYAGSGAVFYQKNRSVVETINDLDGDIVNLFLIIRDRPDELIREIELTPYSREEYDASYRSSEDPLERARRYIIKTNQAIGVRLNGRKSGWRNHKRPNAGGTAAKWAGTAENIQDIATRLKCDATHLVQIENMEALKLIKRYNNKDVLIYLDPPYVIDSRSGGELYKHEMDDNDHKELLSIILHSKAKIVISGYNNDLYNNALKSWHTDQITSRATDGSKIIEKIWMNYEPPYEQVKIWDLCHEGQK